MSELKNIRNLSVSNEIIEQFCRKWQIASLALFGSVLREDFSPQSDVDVLVTYVPDAVITFEARLRMEDELSELLGRKVEILRRELIEQSINPYRRRHILENARTVYELS